MSVRAVDGEDLVATLAAEPGFASLADPRIPVLLWRRGVECPVWASDGGHHLMAKLPAALDGTRRPLAATAARLDVLSGGLAPRHGFRLERLRWAAMEPPLTLTCRLVTVAEEDLLLTALPEPVGSSRPPGAASPPAADVPHETAQSSPASVSPLPARRGQRFMWQADADGRITSVSAELAGIVGGPGSDVVGRRWDELVGSLVDDPDGSVGGAWSRGEGWTRRIIGWRDPDRDRLVPVELSGAPLPAEPGAAPAYRGFGIAHPEQSRAVAPGAFQDLPAAAPPAKVPAPATIGEAMGAAAALGGRTGETVFHMLRAWLAPGSEAQGSTGSEPASSTSRDERGGLTSSERGALQEIARTLNVTEGSGTSTERPSADIVALPRPRPRPDPTALLDQLPAGIVVLRDGVTLFASRPVLDRLGFPDLPEAVAKGALQGLAKLSPDDSAPSTLSLADSTGAPHLFDARTARVDWGDLGADLVLLFPPAAAPVALIEALRLDLDARDRRLEEGRAALDLAADGVLTLDSSARLLSLTRSAERLFGIASNEVVGDSITALIEPHDHRAVIACLEAVRSGPAFGVQRCEVTGRSRNGVPIPLAMRASRTPGTEAGFSVALSDISSFRLLEDDLREARAVAEEASANRAEFLARISHEVRTPLTAITGFAELMLEERFGPLGNERYKGYIRDIRDSGIHVISLVNDLLDLAKATSGTDDLRPTVLDLNAVVQQCVALASPLAGQEKTIVRTSFPAKLPRVFADERSIRQIVINLLSNAIRFTGAGGQVIVSTAAGSHGDVVLSIRDTGPGMSDEEVATALTPFRQVSATRRGDGTGLGLPLSKALTEANGGVFAVTSGRALGTLVEVRLPVEKQGAVAAE